MRIHNTAATNKDHFQELKEAYEVENIDYQNLLNPELLNMEQEANVENADVDVDDENLDQRAIDIEDVHNPEGIGNSYNRMLL